jgi:hypothetical protein
VSDELEKALRFRNYAEELRLIAGDKSSAESRRALLQIASHYDRMANTLEALDRSKNKLSGP